MKIREDIFHEIEGYEKTQDIVQGLANLAFQALSGLFSSRDEVIQYINNFENPKIARLFLEIGEFYYFTKFYYCPKCFPPKRIEKCPYCKSTFEMPAYAVLIMVISIMERLSRGLKEYEEFHKWTGRKDIIKSHLTKFKLPLGVREIRKFVSTLREDWRRDYGSRTKTTEFFKEYLEREEKIEFVKSIRYLIKVPELPPKRMENINGKTREEAKRIYENWKKTVKKEKLLQVG